MKTPRKLTDKQVFALVCVRNGAVRHKIQTISWRKFRRFFAYDSDITRQITSLRRRGLVCFHYTRGVLLTPKGTQALLDHKKERSRGHA